MSAFPVKTKHAFLIENNTQVNCSTITTVPILTLVKVQMLMSENVAVGFFPNLHSENLQNN